MSGGQVVLIEIEKIVFAVPISVISHIVRAVAVTRVPGAPEFLHGVINYHGTIVPVINIRAKLRLPAKRIAAEDKLILLALRNGLTAVIADEVLEYRELNGVTSMKSAEVVKGIQLIESVGFLDNYFLMITDMERLLSPDEALAVDNLLQSLHNITIQPQV